VTFAAEIEAVVRRVVREELAAARAPVVDEWIPHTAWPVGGRKRAARLASSGAISAHRVGRTWMALRSDVDAWIAAQPAPAPRSTEPERRLTIAEVAQRSVDRSRRRKAA